MDLESAARTPYKHYKHKQIARFTIGPYEFKNHLLTVYSEEQDADFRRELAGALAVDQVNIVEVLNLENERQVNIGKVVRGHTSSRSTLADLSAADRLAELERREQELLLREANVANRERNAGAAEPEAPVGDGGDPNPEPASDSEPANTDDSPKPAPALGGLKLGNLAQNT